MEISNIITGILLLVIGGTYMCRGGIESGASWLIFGAMYLVMDSYTVPVKVVRGLYGDVHAVDNRESLGFKIFLRMAFCLLGMAGSATFLAYIWL